MNHRASILAIFLIGSFSVSVFATDTGDIEHLKSLVSAATSLAKVSGCRNTDMVMDNLLVLRQKDEFLALQKAMTVSWRLALTHLDVIADSDMAKTITLCSSWELTKENFVQFLNLAADLVENGKLNSEIFWWSQSPFESDLAGFLVKEHAVSEVQALILRSRKIFENNRQRVEIYDKMLTGESRIKLDQYEAATQENHIYSDKPTDDTTR